MRTQAEIVARMHARASQDPLGFEATEYLPFLDFEHAREFLKDGVTAEEWRGIHKDLSPAGVRAAMIEYMPFAWEKANNFRGISASRSISHYVAWLWLDGNDALADSIQDYQFYGKPQLVEICEYLGVDASQWDDGVRLKQ